MPPLEALRETGGLHAFGPLDHAAGVEGVYNRALHNPAAPELPHRAYFGRGGRDAAGIQARCRAPPRAPHHTTCGLC